MAFVVVHNLRVDMEVGAVNAEAWPFRRAKHALTHTDMTLLPRLISFQIHG
jgi:hypothetical protein